jgi:hypothetical protein
MECQNTLKSKYIVNIIIIIKTNQNKIILTSIKLLIEHWIKVSIKIKQWTSTSYLGKLGS